MPTSIGSNFSSAINETLYQAGFLVPKSTGTPDYIVGVNTATDDVPGTGYWVKSGSTGQVVYTTTSTADVAIQWALDTAAAIGTHQVVAIHGEFAATAQINAVSNVDVFGPAKITVNSTAYAVDGVYFANITNSIWQDVWVVRTGTVTGTAREMTAGSITGNCDNTLQVRNCKFQNSAITAETGEGLQGLVVGANPNVTDICSPLIINTTGISDGASASKLNCGITLWNVGLGEPHLINCTGIGGVGNLSAGIYITESFNGILEGCTGIATSTGPTAVANSPGVLLDGTSGTYRNCRGFAAANGYDIGSSGWMIRSGAPHLMNCEGVSGGAANTFGFYLYWGTAAVLQNCYGHPPIAQYQFNYDDANNGRWRPYASDPYIPIDGVYLWVVVPHAYTVNIGTTVGGSEIAANVDISVAGSVQFTYNKVARAAGEYIYVTPSSAITDNDIIIYFPTMVNYTLTSALKIMTAAPAQIIGGKYISNDALGTVYVGGAYTKWSITNGAEIINETPAQPAIYSLAPITAQNIRNAPTLPEYPTLLTDADLTFYGALGLSTDTLFDLSGNRNHGTIAGATASRLSTGVSANQFDGTNDSINLGSGATLDALTTSFTILCWMNPLDVGEDNNGGIFTKGGKLRANMDSANRISFTITVSAADKAVLTAANAAPFNTWTHQAFVFDETNVLVYSNGVVATGAATAGPVDDHAASDFIIGTLAADHYHFHGGITPFVIIDRALTAVQISDIFDWEKGAFGY